MKLLLALCACALVAADESVVPSTTQLAGGLGYLFRRFLQFADPDQVKLQDEFEVTWRDGLMSSLPYLSPTKVAIGGEEHDAFSFIYSTVSPEQKGPEGFGGWFKNDLSDVFVSHHHGAAVKIHMLTEGGLHKEVVLGNPLDYEDAKLAVIAPKNTYITMESLSKTAFTFLSYVAIPGWEITSNTEFSAKEMKSKFPDHAKIFLGLLKPGVSEDKHHGSHNDHHGDHDEHHGGHDEHHGDHDKHEDEHHGHHGHYRHRRSNRYY